MLICELFENNIIVEANIPYSDYGYWIKPDGEVLVVALHAHARIAHENGMNGYYDALAAGWIRIAAPFNNMSVELQVQTTTARAFSTLRRMTKMKEFENFFVEGNYKGGGRQDRRLTKSFTGANQMLGYVNELRQAVHPLEEEELIEAEIPDTDYGYWIKPDGEAIPVSLYGHHSVAQKHGIAGKNYQVYDNAFKSGWIRIVSKEHVGNLAIQLQEGKASARAFSTLRRIANSEEFSKFYVDVNRVKPEGRETKSFSTAHHMLAFVNEIRQPSQELTEAEIPETDYGYWIKPDGTALPVEYQEHSYVAKSKGGFKSSPYSEALSAGWVRLISVTDGSTLYIEFQTKIMTGRAFNTLRRIAKSGDYTHFNVDASRDNNIMRAEYDLSKKFTEVAPMLQYVNTLRQPNTELTEDDLMEMEIPETRYGYWITNTGEAITVPYQSHREIASDHGYSGYMGAFNNGWIRLITAEEPEAMSIEFLSHVPNAKAFNMLRRITRVGTFNKFYLDILEQGKPRYDSVRKQFTSPHQMLAYVNEMRRPVAKAELTEAAIPATNYGYWISPEGTFHPVGYQKHKIVGRELKIMVQSFGEAYGKGWVRVGSNVKEAPGMLFVEFAPHKLTARCMSAIRHLAKSQEFTKFYCRDKDFDRIGPFLATVQEQGRMQQELTEEDLMEMEIPNTDYGYWITDTCEFIPVPYQKHDKVCADHGFMDKYSAMKNGWLRVMSHDPDYKGLYIEFYAQTLKARQISALGALARKEYFPKYSAAVHSGNHIDGVGYGKTFEELNNFLGYIRKASRPRTEEEEHAEQMKRLQSMNLFGDD